MMRMRLKTIKTDTNTETNNLHLVLKHQWYNLIESGEKTSEYREIKPYWENRFKKHYDTVTFQKGYTKNPPTMVFEIISIEKTSEKNDLNLDEVYEIKLGKRLK